MHHVPVMVGYFWRDRGIRVGMLSNQSEGKSKTNFASTEALSTTATRGEENQSLQADG
jgi:hypothetical protein